MARLLWGLLVVCLALGRAGAAQADAGPSSGVNRLTLIPAWPGGPQDQPPSFALEALPPATFDVVFDAELHGDPAETYYAERLRLLAATYRVLVFDSAEMRKNWGVDRPRPLAVLGQDENGAFRLDQANLAGGHAYAWVVVAQFENQPSGTAALWSAPLYFRTTPVEDAVPSTLPADDQQALRVMGGINAQQRRSALGEATALRGLALFYNFAAATDTFVCAPLNENQPCPWPDPPAAHALPFGALLDLGDIASTMLILQHQTPGKAETKRIVALSTAVHRFAGRGGVTAADATAAAADPAGAGLAAAPEAKALEQLASLGSRLETLSKRPSSEPLTGVLSELGVAVDEVLGTGTRPALPVGVDSFPPYARATLRRIEGLEEYAPRMQLVLSAAEWSAWESWLRAQRGELTLMAEDVERGRLSRQQLDAQIQRDRAIAPPAFPDKWRYVDGQSGVVDTERVGRIAPVSTAEQRHLLRELYWVQLSRFAQQLWPEQSNNGG